MINFCCQALSRLISLMYSDQLYIQQDTLSAQNSLPAKQTLGRLKLKWIIFDKQKNIRLSEQFSRKKHISNFKKTAVHFSPTTLVKLYRMWKKNSEDDHFLQTFRLQIFLLYIK